MAITCWAFADEARRSQYGFGGKVNEKTGEMSYGFAQQPARCPAECVVIGFTGTPIEKKDANTRAVFGDYISIYASGSEAAMRRRGRPGG